MKNQRFRDYIYWGVTAVAVIAASVAFALLLINIQAVKSKVGVLVGILMPIIYGAVLAYLLLPIYNRCRKIVAEFVAKYTKNVRVIQGVAKSIATVVSLIVIVVIVSGLIWLLLPQIYSSIMGFQASLEGNLNNLTIWLSKLLDANPAIKSSVIPVYEQLADTFQQWLSTDLLPSMSTVISGLSSGLIGVVVLLKNILIGLIVMVYFLNIKNTFAAQGKKIFYSLMQVKTANALVEHFRFVHHVFGGFITGKLLDSLIIGLLCFFFMSIFKMPYVLLVSVIIGVTNVIPFFGPFIGAVPSAFLILLVSPAKCLSFLVLILALQQFDGNILGPKILGDSTGLPSFWVLFSILLFGGLFGFVGMIIAVPTTAVFYRLFSEFVGKNLQKRDLSDKTADYMELDHIDENKKTFIK